MNKRKRDKRHDPYKGKKIKPQYDIRNNPDFETESKAKNEVKRRLQGMTGVLTSSQLSPAETKRVRAVYKRLDGCRPGHLHRCQSLACSICYMGWRRKHAAEAVKFTERYKLPNVAFITVISKFWMIPAGRLHALRPLTPFNSLRRQLDLCGFKDKYAAFGYIDGRYYSNPHPRYSVHIHFAVPYKDYADLKPHLEMLRDRFYTKGRHKGVKSAPMVVSLVSGKKATKENLLRRFSYDQKSFWSRKIKYRKVGDPKPKYKHARIPEPHHTRQLIWIDKFLPANIRFMYGCEYKKGKLLRTF